MHMCIGPEWTGCPVVHGELKAEHWGCRVLALYPIAHAPRVQRLLPQLLDMREPLALAFLAPALSRLADQEDRLPDQGWRACLRSPQACPPCPALPSHHPSQPITHPGHCTVTCSMRGLQE